MLQSLRKPSHNTRQTRHPRFFLEKSNKTVPKLFFYSNRLVPYQSPRSRLKNDFTGIERIKDNSRHYSRF